MTRVHLGISTCPNDTFAFHALMAGRVDPRGLDFRVELADVEELNRRLAAGEFDVAKGSFHAALKLAGELGVLPSGSALGFGNGPLLLARAAGTRPGPGSRVLAPGANTTASLLYRLFHPDGAEPEQVVFSEILPALERGAADFGVCIHEGRFTYAEHGLALVEDLGERWEAATGAPLPLGGIFARRSLPLDLLRAVAETIADSLEYAYAHPEETLPTMRAHAVELDDAVIRAHVELYVNDWTRELGPEGRRALAELSRRAAAAGVLPRDVPTLQVVGAPRVFHLVPRAVWDARAPDAGAWEPESLAREGFVHLSLAGQLAGTIRTHFAGAGELVLLEADPRALDDALRFERSRDGAWFPHLYRALEAEDLLRRWDLPAGAPPPALARVAEDDAVPGAAPVS